MRTAGLPAPSVVRCAKIATIETRDADRIGSLPQLDRRKVGERLAHALAGAVAFRPVRR